MLAPDMESDLSSVTDSQAQQLHAYLRAWTGRIQAKFATFEPTPLCPLRAKKRVREEFEGDEELERKEVKRNKVLSDTPDLQFENPITDASPITWEPFPAWNLPYSPPRRRPRITERVARAIPLLVLVLRKNHAETYV